MSAQHLTRDICLFHRETYFLREILCGHSADIYLLLRFSALVLFFKDIKRPADAPHAVGVIDLKSKRVRGESE